MKKIIFKSSLILLLAIVLFSCTVTPEPDKKQDELKLTVATVGESSVELSWNAVQGIDEYVVLISTSAGGNFMPYDLSPETSCSVTELQPSKQYFFKVAELKGYDDNSEFGVVLGKTSNIADVTTKAGSLTTPVVNTSSVTEYSIAFTWGSVTGATGYFIYKVGGEWEDYSYQYISDGTTTFTDSAYYEGNTTHRYKVLAYNSLTGQNSELSLELALTTKSSSLTPSAVNTTPGSYDLGLEVAVAAGQSVAFFNFEKISDMYPITSTTDSMNQLSEYTRYGVMPGKSYHYKVKTFNKAEGKASPISDFYSITIPQPELTIVPGNVKLDSLTHRDTSYPDYYDVDLTISWDAAPEAEEYFIYEIRYPGTADEYVNYLGRTANTSYSTSLSNSAPGSTHSIDLRVRAVKTSTKQAGPFSPPLMVKVK